MTELEEIKRICKERRIKPEQLLEEMIAPLKERISNSPGELIGALTRNYERCSHGITPAHYALRETLYMGLITPETKFPTKGNSFAVFLSGIDKPHSLEINSGWERDFTKEKGRSFSDWRTDSHKLLYFRDKPPEIPEDSYKHGCFGSHSTAFPTEKPRLELYAGNQQTFPFLQQNLEGWRYTQLSKLLEYELPITEKMTKKIEEEQLKIFDEMRKTGAGKDRIFELLKTAIKRGYHETGMQVNRQLDAGVVMKISLKDFFAQKKARFEL